MSTARKNEAIKVSVIGTRGIPATWGGIEHQCEEVYMRLVQNGFQISIYTRPQYVDELRKTYKGIDIINLKAWKGKHAEAFSHSLLSTLHACFSDADILHFYAQGPSLFTWIPRLLVPHKKVVFTCQGLDWQRAKWSGLASRILKMGEWCSAIFPHAQTGVSQQILDHYLQHYGRKLTLIPNGANPAQLLPVNIIREKFDLEARKYLLFVGRLVPEKAIHELILAYRQLDTDIKLVIAGDTSATDSYVNHLKELAQKDVRIIFTSYVFGDTLSELFTNALAYVSASQLEGLPLTMMEAMSYGIPILVSDIPPHLEVLEQLPKSSLNCTFETGNIDHIRQRLSEMIQAPEPEREALGQVAQKLVLQKYGWDKIALQFAQFYHQFTDRKTDQTILLHPQYMAMEEIRLPLAEKHLFSEK